PVARVISSQLVEAMKEEKADPYDTHPPLKQRLEAVAHLPAGDTPNPDPAASDLLNEVADLERDLLATLADAQTAAQLKPVSWDEVGPQVFRPQWEELAQTNAPVLAGVTPENLPTLATAQLQPFAARCLTLEGKTLAGDEAVGLAKWVIGAALTTALLRRGAQVHSPPGENVSVRLGDAVLEPFVLLPHLTSGSLTDAAWQQTVDAFGMRGLDLGEPASPAHSATTR
ncbi:MAG: hypothetical protein IT580_01925, partial [Verrucomicrobiales bacterium]|nr:hypothetical protein [Verrucomicrobiales bacterium]